MTTISGFRANIKKYYNEVLLTEEPLIITKGDTGAVLIPLEQYNVMQRSLELFGNSQAIQDLREAAEGDYPPALNDMAWQLFKGRLIPNDINKAEEYARRGAVLGDDGCQLWLGQILRSVGRNQEALEWFIKSAQQGQGWSAFLAGEMYENGEGVPANLQEAINFYRMSAQTTNSYGEDARKALDRLGVQLYGEGEYLQHALSIDIDPNQDIESLYTSGRSWSTFHQADQLASLIAAAQRGHGQAALLAGEMYEQGQGTRKDISKAKYWYQRSVDSQNFYGRYAQEHLDRLASQGSAGGSDLAGKLEDLNDTLSDLGDTISSGLKSLFGKLRR